jgi:hypothetical protein
VGAFSSFSIVVTGYPAVTLSESAGDTLPGGVGFNAATGVLSGTPAAGSGGQYTLHFTAHNGIGSDANQTFTLTVNQPAAITSVNNTSLTVGSAGSFKIMVTGYPVPTLTESAADTLPGGVSFNGSTGILGGTPAAGSGGPYTLHFTAHNGIGADASQTFALTVNQAAAFTSAANTVFTPGTSSSFKVMAGGYPTPTLSENPSDMLPGGVGFNAATGILSGTPPAGTTGSFTLHFTAHNGIGSDATQAFTLFLGQAAQFTSPASFAFTVGTAGSFGVTASGTPRPTLSENASDMLPAGVMFNAATGILSGTPTGNGGTFTLHFTAHNGIGSDATQTFTLTVDEPPTSSVAALPSFSPASVALSWSGSVGFGASSIASYDIFVSDNNGAFSLFLHNTTQTSANYTGQDGHVYGFYSVATDNLGHRQPDPGAAQASTTVDATAPTSNVGALPGFSPASFTVSWSGSDNTGGSGLAGFDVFVSDNGAGFAPLLTATTLTSTSFMGQDGHTYGFYSVAIDNAGNRQPTPSAAQASTLVDATAPTSTVAALPAFEPAMFIASWSGSDPGAPATGSGLATFDVFVSDNGAAPAPLLTATTQTSIAFTGQDGHRYGFYSVATDKAGNRQPTPAAAQTTTQVDTVPPTSMVAALPAFEPATFTVNWSGSDSTGASGLAVFDVFVSDNGGAFKPLVTATTQTSTSLSGQDGHTYGFYCVATDNVGNREATPAAAQASTRVDAMPPTSAAAALPAFEPATFTVSWAGSDPGAPATGSGLATFDVYVSDNGATSRLLAGTTQTSTSFTGQDGHTYGFYSVARDRVGNLQPAPSTAQATTRVDTQPPTSTVAALPIYSRPYFTISWSGSDNPGGSDNISFAIYVSDNGSAFQRIYSAQSTDPTSTQFQGVAGHTYRFYSLATDSAGNTQPVPAAPQATTQAILDTGNKQYVAAAYQSLLLRPVDVSGLNFWAGQLDNNVDRGVIAAQLTHSAEYYQTNVIKPAYLKFLNRAADQAGLDFWTKQLQHGTTDEQMQAGFIASPEFYANANHSAPPVPRSPAADRLWIDALYQSLLGRLPDQVGEDFWTNQLQGTQTLIQVANGFTGSPEGLSLRIQQTYQRYLGRGADAAGLAFWLTEYRMGAVNEDIVTGFVGSDEFFRQATM